VDVTVDVSQLAAHYSPPFGVEFTLTDGSGAGDLNNTVTLSGFTFGTGGMAGPAPPSPAIGGAAGTLSTAVVLTEPSPINDFVQQFTPGTLLTFKVIATTNIDGSGTPDSFSFLVLQNLDTASGTGDKIPTRDPSGADTFLTIDLSGPGSTFRSFDSKTGDVSIRVVQEGSPVVPEPTTLATAGSGLVTLAVWGWSRRRRTAA
jgi:hypothetical protein